MKKQNKKPDLSVVEEMLPKPSFTDPQGSWTGLPQDEYEVPVQDADDL